MSSWSYPQQGPRRGDYRGNQASFTFNGMNPGHQGILRHPDHRQYSNEYYNMGRAPAPQIMPPSAFVGNNPQVSSQIGNSNPVPYQITLSFNAPAPEPTYQHPSQTSQNRYYPNPTNPAMVHPDLPPSSSLYQNEPPPSLHLHTNKPTGNFVTRENVTSGRPYEGSSNGRPYEGSSSGRPYEGSSSGRPFERSSGGRGRGSRMKGFYSKSCVDLRTQQCSDAAGKDFFLHETDNLSSKSETQGRGQGRGRGRFKPQRGNKRGSSGAKAAANDRLELEESSDEKNDDYNSDQSSETSSDKGGRGRLTGFHGRRGRRGRGTHRGFHNHGRCSSSGIGGQNEVPSYSVEEKSLSHDFVPRVCDEQECKTKRRPEPVADANKSGCSNNPGGKVPLAAKMKAKPETQAKVQKLFVTLNFNARFDSAATLKGLIQSSLQFQEEDDYTLLYDQILFRPNDSKAVCKFVISGPSVSKAKWSVKKMVHTLREKHKIDMDYEWSRDNAENEDCKGGKNLPPKIGGDTASASKESDSCKPIPAVVLFKVDKSFQTKESFKSYLRKATSDLLFDFDMDDTSISLSAQFSECLIKTRSKADARRLRQKLNKLGNQDQNTLMSSSQDKQSKSSLKKSVLQTQHEQAISTMASKKSALLQEHDKKVEQLKGKCTNIVSAKMSKDKEIDFHALRDKLAEALKHREFFLASYGIIYRNLEGLNLLTAKSEDVCRFKNLFDIECSRLINALPIYAHRDKIIENVKSNQVTILIGENGCGRTTQTPQYLFDAGYAAKGIIMCTQPEELTAVALAEKVAKELSVKVGTLVGYKSDLETKTNSSTKILFATDHSLLNECLEDPELRKYSCIIVDQAHEHNMHTDLLLGMIKYLLPKRRDLKVILLLPADQSDRFVQYYNVKKGLIVSGRNFVVETLYSQDHLEDFEDNESKVVSKAMEVHAEENEGDILVFLSQPIETLRRCQEFGQRYAGENNFKCMPLHDQLHPQELKKVFERLPQNQRKIIFATKYAESLSIEGVRYVIDSGISAETKYDSEQKVNLMKTCFVTQYSADQRKNCAGHSVGGKCFRLYSKKAFNSLSRTKAPEILRVHLEKAVLKIFELGVDLRVYEFIQAPSDMSLELALETLTQYEAINGHTITEMGKLISKLPYDLKLGFLIYGAKKKALLFDAIVLATIISFGSDFSFTSFSDTASYSEARNLKSYGNEKMDCFEWLNVYKTWSELPKKERSTWCRTHSVNYKLLNSVHLCIENVRSILLKDFDIQCNHTFSSKPDALVTLKKLYMKSKYPQFSNF